MYTQSGKPHLLASSGLCTREPQLRRGAGARLVAVGTLVTELCVLRTFGGVDFSLIFICAQYVPEFLWDRLRASIQFPVMPKRAQYARFSGEDRLVFVIAYFSIDTGA